MAKINYLKCLVFNKYLRDIKDRGLYRWGKGGGKQVTETVFEGPWMLDLPDFKSSHSKFVQRTSGNFDERIEESKMTISYQ